MLRPPALAVAIFLSLFFNPINSLADEIPPLPSITGEIAGAIGGSFEVSPSGAATYAIPLAVPPGTAGLEPKLALTYDSQGSNGPLGIGWNISGLPIISRCPANKADDGYIQGVSLNTQDRFCLDGAKLSAIQGVYGAEGTEYRTTNESFSKVTYVDSITGWIVRTKTGQTYEFGKTADSKVEAQGSSTALLWRANKLSDARGNYMTFSYAENNAIGESYPTQIDYTGNIQAPYNSVKFIYENRPDPSFGYIAGTKSSLTKRLTKIEISADNSLTREYRLTYDTAPVSSRSRIISIEECDDQGICLNPTTFSWSNGSKAMQPQTLALMDGSFGQVYEPTGHELETIDLNADGKTDRIWQPHSWWMHPGGLSSYERAIAFPNGATFESPLSYYVGNTLESPYYAYADVNGDGYPDRIELTKSPGKIQVALNTAGTFGQFSTWLQGDDIYNNEFPNIQRSERWLDLNADGRADHLFVNNGKVMASYSTGSSFTPPTEVVFPSDSCLPYSFHGDFEGIADFNGDGLPDLITRSINCGNKVLVSINNGNGFETPTVWFDQQVYQVDPHGYYILFGDVNGDGLDDYVWKNGPSNEVGVSISTGTGFLPPAIWMNESTIDGRSAWSGDGARNFLADMNSDGKADFVTNPDGQRAWYVLYSNGNNFHAYEKILPETVSYNGTTYEFWFQHIDWVDHNGDGLLDVTYVIDEAQAQHLFLRLHDGETPDRIKKITTGFGVETKIEYKPLTDNSIYTKNNNATYPAIDIQGALQVVSAYEVSNGIGGFSRYSYKYTGLKAELNGRGLTGFESVKVTDETTGNWTTTFYRQDFPYINLVRRSTTNLADNTLIQETDNVWDVKNLNNNGSYFTFIKETVTSDYETTSSLVKRKTTTNTFDDWGNLIESTVVWNDGSSETTSSTYNNNPTNWQIGYLLTSSVTKTGGGTTPPQAITRSSRFTYHPTNGLLVQEEIEPNDLALRISKVYEHDSFGNITKTTTSANGVNNRVTQSSYDNRGQFPVTTTNVLGFTTQHEYEAALGKEIKRTDPNGIVTEWEFDSFGRPYMEFRADGTESRTLYLESNSSTALPDEAYYIRTDSSGMPPSITHYDILGREIRKEGVGFNGQPILVDKAYDERGLLTHVSEPYFADTSPIWNVSEYDVLGRIEQINAPGDIHTSYSYNGLTTTTVNALGQQSTKVMDVLGRLVSSTDDQGNVVTYKYDCYGNMTEVRDPNGNITVTTYDKQGRKKKIIDPDAGTSDFTYNAYGELTAQKNGNNELIQFEYDDAGRVTKRVSPEGVETWGYDTAPFAKGKLVLVTGLNGYQERYSYDSLGRPVETKTSIQGQQFTSSQIYDVLSRVDTYTYPSGFEVQNVYNQHGYFSQMVRTDTGVSIWKADIRNARGQIEQQTLGNGLVTAKSYVPATGIIKSIQTGVVQNLDFTFDKIGNLTQRRDLRLNLTEDFKYDNLNRVTESKVIGLSAITVSYDTLGNISSRSDVGTYLYGENGAGPHAVTTITGSKPNTYGYDDAGNRTTSLSGAVQYSSNGKPTVITDGPSRIEFKLNPSDERIVERKFTNNLLKETKLYVGSSFEQRITPNSKSAVHYIQSGDGLVAVYTTTSSFRTTPATAGATGLVGTSAGIGGTTPIKPAPTLPQATTSMRYLLLDHLGSIQTITNELGEIVEISSFDAWGKRRDPTTWESVDYTITSKVDKGFTGHEHLDSVNLIHMNGRIYDPIIGRFISPDPFIQDPTNLQSLNRYSYVLNNPLSHTDPTGYFSFKKFWKSFKTVAKIGIAIGVAYYTGGILNGWLSGGLLKGFVASGLSGLGASFASTITSSALNGGNISAGFKSWLKQAPLNFLSAGISNEIGHGVIKDIIGNTDEARAIAHGISGGIFSAAEGGNFGSGFAASFVGGYTENTNNFALTVIASGSAAALTGGKFGDGAMRGAFIYMYNKMGNPNALLISRTGSAPSSDEIEPYSKAFDHLMDSTHNFVLQNACGIDGPGTVLSGWGAISAVGVGLGFAVGGPVAVAIGGTGFLLNTIYAINTPGGWDDMSVGLNKSFGKFVVGKFGSPGVKAYYDGTKVVDKLKHAHQLDQSCW